METLHYYIEYLGNFVELPLGETVVGRDVGCKLRFNDPSVSRRHLRFIRRVDQVFLEDMNSSNGTKLNGRTLTAPEKLDDGDAIMVGGRTLFIRISDSEQITSQTLNLHELPMPVVDARAVNARTRTQQMSAIAPMESDTLVPTLPPSSSPFAAQQRCPNCGASVTDLEDECETCHFQWGGFRANSRTDVRKAVTVSKRRHDRHPIELQLVYVSSELEIEATSRDLSATGVFVCSQVLDPVGTTCTLTFLLDGGPPLKIEGVVRRVVEHHESAETGLGVEFSTVGASERSWLDTLIASQAK